MSHTAKSKRLQRFPLIRKGLSASGRLGLLPRPSRPLRYVQCVSFPRSGHHLLVRTLGRFFGRKRGSFRYCSFYNCCRTVPCINPDTCFAKNHDHHGKLSIVQDRLYVVQIRHPLPATVSNYPLHLRHARQSGFEPYSWEEFAVINVTKWRKMVRRWALSQSTPPQIVLRYEDLVADPFTQVSEVVRLLWPERAERLGPWLSLRLRATIATMDVRATRSIQDFEHYDEAFLQELERSAEPELSELGYGRLIRVAS